MSDNADRIRINRRRGKRVDPFTMVELLVVVAIIGILATLLLPALKAAKAKALESTCLNNQRQINLLFQSYACDYDDCVPLGYKWYMFNLCEAGLAVDPIPLKNIGFWACPANLQWMLEGYSWASSAAHCSGYTINYHVGPTIGDTQTGVRKQHTIPHPSQLFHTVEAGNTKGTYRAVNRQDETFHSSHAGWPHGGRSGIFFFDGHGTVTMLPLVGGWPTTTTVLEPWIFP